MVVTLHNFVDLSSFQILYHKYMEHDPKFTMARSYHLRRVCYFVFLAIVNMLVLVSVQTSLVQLAPAEGFKIFSEVIFPGEIITLECVGSGMTNCEISLYLNNIVIYENGQLESGDYDVTETGSSCSLNIHISNVTAQHKGIYKCRVDDESTTMEDTYELNVVTASPHCFAKCVESENSFQLFCYTSSLVTDPPVFMIWEITIPGSDPMRFTHYSIDRLIHGFILKTVGVSHLNIQKENLTIGYRCSYSYDPSQSCFIYLTSPVINDVSSPTITTDIATSQTNFTLRNTLPLLTLVPDNHEQTSVNQIRNIIITSFTTAILILGVILVIKMYKRRNKLLFQGRKKGTDSLTRNDLVQTGTAVSRSPVSVSLELSTYAEIPGNSEGQKYATKIFRNELEIPNILGDSKQQQYETQIVTNESETPEIHRDFKEQTYETKIFRN